MISDKFWTPTNNWDELPEGEVLVAIRNGRDKTEHHVAKVGLNSKGQHFITVGHAFHFDVGKLIGYKTFELSGF